MRKEVDIFEKFIHEKLREKNIKDFSVRVEVCREGYGVILEGKNQKFAYSTLDITQHEMILLVILKTIKQILDEEKEKIR